jgi:hypothetical protein
MAFINWGGETPEQRAIRERIEQEALYEQVVRLKLQAQGGVGGGSQIQTSEWIDLALSKLNDRYSEITALVPNIYLFWDDYTTSGETGDPLPGISDGGDDMYDGGNYLNTNLTNLYDIIKGGEIDEDNILAAASIPYTHTQADNDDDDNEYTSPPMDGIVSDGNSYFGPGSKYFTNMYPGLFVMVADNTSVSEFSITGNVGSDGDTVNGGAIEAITPGWTLFYKTNLEDPLDTDPTINHLILIPGSQAGITHEFEDDEGDGNDDHAVIGISDRSRIVYALVSTQPGEAVLTSDQFINVAEKILEIIL